MKKIQAYFYQCEICGKKYIDQSDAENCESRAVSQNKGVVTGDRVIITHGDGVGETVTVDSVCILSNDCGDYAWDRYGHTVAVTAKFLDGSQRLLPFDSYERDVETTSKTTTTTQSKKHEHWIYASLNRRSVA